MTRAEDERPTSEVNARRARLAALVGAVLFMVARVPQLIVAPRLWAEEATVYLAHAVHHSFLQSLLLVPTSRGPAGYFNLAANLPAAAAAHLLPLEQAPWPTLAIAFLCQLLPILVVLFGDSFFWRTTSQRLVCCALILLTAPVVPEVWLNSINAQVFCGLTVLLVACERLDALTPRRRLVYRLILVFCALSGPYVAILLPVLWLRARLAPGRTEARLHVRMVLITTTAQALAYFAAWASSAIEIDRLRSATAGDRILAVLIHHVLRPFVGVLATDDPGLVVSQAWNATVRVPSLLILASAAGVLILLAALIVPFAREHRRGPFVLLPLAFVVWSGATTVLSYGVPTSRYGVLPGISLLLTVAVLGWQHPRRRARGIAMGLVATAIACGLLTHLLPSAHARPSFEGPAWPEEVADWRHDPDRGILLWPSRDGLGWRVHLAEPERFVRIRETLASTPPFQLTSRGDWVEYRITIPGLPPDFKMIWTAEMTQSSETADVEVKVSDAAGDPLAVRALDGLIEQRPQRFLIEATSLPKAPQRRWHEAVELGFRLRATGRTPVRLEVEGLEIAPRIEGLLDPWLEPVRLPHRLYAEIAQPIDLEATGVAMAESLWHDHDLRWAAPDQARAAARWPDGPRGLRLRAVGPPESSELRYAASPIAATWAAPFAGLGGPAVMVAAQLVLYALLMTLVYQWLTGPRGGRVLFVCGLFLASVGLGYAFLPQDQILWMTCLFVPLWSWRSGWLERRPRTAAALCGGLLACAGSCLPGPAMVIGGILLADRLTAARRASNDGRRRLVWIQIAVLVTTAASLLLALHVAGHGPAANARSEHEGVRMFAQPPPLAAEGFERRGEVIPRRTTRDWVQDAATGSARLLAGRPSGILFAFPFLLVAFAAAVLAPGEGSSRTGRVRQPPSGPRRGDLLLLGGLLVLSVWAAAGPPGGDVGVLGAPRFAVIFPLFALLPQQIPFRSWVLLLLLVASILLVAPSLVMVWYPIGL